MSAFFLLQESFLCGCFQSADISPFGLCSHTENKERGSCEDEFVRGLEWYTCLPSLILTLDIVFKYFPYYLSKISPTEKYQTRCLWKKMAKNQLS
jgi:hypothetical protein